MTILRAYVSKLEVGESVSAFHGGGRLVCWIFSVQFLGRPLRILISQPSQSLGAGRCAGGALCHLQLLSMSFLSISCTKSLAMYVLWETSRSQRAFLPKEDKIKAVWPSAISPLWETSMEQISFQLETKYWETEWLLFKINWDQKKQRVSLLVVRRLLQGRRINAVPIDKFISVHRRLPGRAGASGAAAGCGQTLHWRRGLRRLSLVFGVERPGRTRWVGCSRLTLLCVLLGVNSLWHSLCVFTAGTCFLFLCLLCPVSLESSH